MTDHDYDQQQWSECPSGELRALARRLSSQHRRERTLKTSQFGTLGLLLVAAGIVTAELSNARRGPVLVGAINCKECAAQFEAYHLHLIHQVSMDAALADQMRAHLTKCKGCRVAFEKQYPGLLIAIATDAACLLVGVRHCPISTGMALLAAASSP